MSIERYIAKKMRIKELLTNIFNQGNEQESSSLQLKNGEKIYRCNVLALILNKEVVGSLTNLLIDDGSGQIVVRSFEPNKCVEELQVGHPVLVIGRIRKYNEERYISPEIIKKVSPGWLKVRAIELQSEQNLIEPVAEVDQAEEIELKNNNTSETIETDDLLPLQKMVNLINKLDSGEGVLIEEIIEKSPIENTEVILEQMLEKGDIFQIMPGKVKVL